VKAFARELAIVVAVAGAASLALGLGIALLKGDDILRWFAYGLEIGGAVLIGLGFLSAGGESPRKKYLLLHGMSKDEAPPRESRLLVFVLVGVALVGAGTLFELALF
jgi:hypothetical protein